MGGWGTKKRQKITVKLKVQVEGATRDTTREWQIDSWQGGSGGVGGSGYEDELIGVPVGSIKRQGEQMGQFVRAPGVGTGS